MKTGTHTQVPVPMTMAQSDAAEKHFSLIVWKSQDFFLSLPPKSYY